jgi:hypothetical protein
MGKGRLREYTIKEAMEVRAAREARDFREGWVRALNVIE